MNDLKSPSFDWNNIGFGYRKTDFSYLSYYENGKWDEGILTPEDKITISASSTCIHYGQQAFEGLKAYYTKDGKIQIFRPDENAKRLNQTCKRMLMPEVPVEKFLDAVNRVVKANSAYVPPYGSKASLYIRPYIIGIGDNLGLKAASSYLFGIFVSPVGVYSKNATPVRFIVTEYDRAAPKGTGGVKVGGNYASSLYPSKLAKDQGFFDCIYLDPKTHTRIEEVGTANFFAITSDNRFVTPTSESILHSITRKSLIYIAENYLNMKVEEREIYISELADFLEAGACGTALCITPIAGIQYKDRYYTFHSETEAGPITKELLRILTGMHVGDIEAPKGWIYEVK